MVGGGNSRDLVGLDFDHLLLSIRTDKRLLGQRQSLSLGLWLLDYILRAQGALAAS